MSDFAAPSAPAPASTPAPAAPSAPSGNTGSGGITESAKSRPTSTGPNSKLAEGNNPAPTTPSEKAADERRKYKLRVDGADIDEELTDTEVSTRLQKAKAAEKRMQEAAEYKKNYNAFLEAFEKDPFQAAKLLRPDMDLDALAEQRLIDRFTAEEQKKADPGAYERAQLQKKIEEYEGREKTAKEQAQQLAQNEHDTKIGQEMEREFLEALEISGLPKDRHFLRMMAEVADVNLDHGIELTPKQMAAEVNSQIRQQHQHVTRALDGQHLIDHLGDDVYRKVLKYSVEKHRKAQSAPTAPRAAGDETEQQRADRKAKSGSQIRQFFRGLKDGE